MSDNTIDMTPTWQGILPGLMAALTNGTPEGQRIAREELEKMARVADLAVAHQKAEKQLLLDDMQAVQLKHTCRTVAELRAALDEITIADPDTLYLRTESGDQIDSVAILEKPLTDGSFVYDIAFLTESGDHADY